MKLFSILYNIYSHPLNKKKPLKSILRFLKWQFFSRFYDFPIILPFSNSSRYFCWNGLTGITGNWYYGLMEMEEMSFASHFLRESDIFYDIGANVGAYSILTSQHSNCKVYCFEPHPITFKYLLDNVKIQDKPELIIAYNYALGEFNEEVKFTTNLDTVNHVCIDEDSNYVKVSVKKLDELNLPIPSLVKIDVEGFEYQVLKGSKNILNDLTVKAIIIELNSSGKKFGHNDQDIHDFLLSYNFKPFTYDPFSRKIIPLDFYLNHNTIYIRDFLFCQERVSNAKSLNLSNQTSI